ncbi:MAG TPA: aminoacyl-tRNA hydrolase [Clostridia bacterium]|nr:aminoacyl-tRNA hydrolase [Clostridia bacterium]
MPMFEKTTTYLIVGLGNPDDKYQNTYHNVGFLCLDEIAKKLGVTFNKGECRAITAHIKNGKTKIILAKPITYMNLSGESVNELVRKYKIESDKFLVVYDDVDLPLGDVRIRSKGSGGTHNGMRDIIAKTHTEDFARIRIGIGQPRVSELADYVLSKITDKDFDVLQKAFIKTADAVKEFTDKTDIIKVMQKYN